MGRGFGWYALTVAGVAIAVSAAIGCSEPTVSGEPELDSPDGGGPDIDEVDAAVARSGSLRVLAYNVAGLPEPLSSSEPITNTPQISPKLNGHDLVLVQEDFSYHDALARDAEHPHQSEPMSTPTALELGDGLNRFSMSPFDDFSREAWQECNGIVGAANDCLTAKGFSAARHQLADGIVVDVYNLHMDAGGSGGDVEARDAQVAQLIAAIEARSAGRAVIVAGDTNMGDDDEPQVQALINGAGLTDSCRQLDCPEPTRIDRILFRSSPELELRAARWAVDTSFVDADGDPLSDHEAVAATLVWTER